MCTLVFTFRVSESKKWTKVCRFTVGKKTLSPLSDGMSIFGQECVQNHVFCDETKTSAFTTLARNSLFRSSWIKNEYSTVEWRRFFAEPPFCARLSSLFRRVRTGRAANGHFRLELWRFFGNAAETIVKYKESGALRSDLKTPGGRMGRLGRGKMY